MTTIQLQPYDIEHDYFDSINSKTWLNALAQNQMTIGNFNDSQITLQQSAIRDILLSTQALATNITGEAGTGKTFLQLSLLKQLKQRNHNFIRLGPTHASIANLPSESMTYQSFFAMNPQLDYLNPDLRQKFISDMAAAAVRHPFIQKAKHRPNELNTIIIEEAAMISADIIDLIFAALEKIAPGKKKFRVFLFFDILQLVPVTGRLLIESTIIQNAPTLILTTNIRQSGSPDDDDFLDLLRAIAKDKMQPHHYCILQSRKVRPQYPIHRRLCARNLTVDEHNLRHLISLQPEPIYTILSLDTALKRMPDYSLAKLPQSLKLAKGAKIVFESSSLHDIGLYNGLTGTIQDFLITENNILLPLIFIDRYNLALIVHPILEEIHADIPGAFATSTIATRLQFPFSIAEATTIHKIQGQTLSENTEIDLLFMNSPGQIYTALSRLTSLHHLFLKNLPPMQYSGTIENVKPSPIALDWCKKVGLF